MLRSRGTYSLPRPHGRTTHMVAHVRQRVIDGHRAVCYSPDDARPDRWRWCLVCQECSCSGGGRNMLCFIGSEDAATGWQTSHWTTVTAKLSIADLLPTRRGNNQVVQTTAASTFILSSIQERKSAALALADHLEAATLQAQGRTVELCHLAWRYARAC